MGIIVPMRELCKSLYMQVLMRKYICKSLYESIRQVLMRKYVCTNPSPYEKVQVSMREST